MTAEKLTFNAAVQFTLYCVTCGANHTLVSGDLERVVYAMSGKIHDLRDDLVNETTEAGFEPEGAMCYLEALDLANDTEGYGEHVAACIEARQRKQDEE